MNHEPETRDLPLHHVISDIIDVEATETDPRWVRVRGRLRLPADAAMSKLVERLRPLGLIPQLRREGTAASLIIVPARSPGRSKRLVNLVLFLLTIATTLVAGAAAAGVNPFTERWGILAGIPFSASLLTILGAHEFGHYLTCRRHRVAATLPYFIPSPFPLLGTFGAVIRIKSPIPSRRALLEIGLAGPLAGLAFAVPVAYVGLRLSHSVEVNDIAQGAITFGNSLLFSLLSRLAHGPLGEGQDIMLHPLALAGWVGLYVTALNLLPGGQLDGGHIAYALFGRWHMAVGAATLVLLLVLGMLVSQVWLVIGILLIVMGLRHPPPLDDITTLDGRQRVWALVAFALLAITFIPNPLGFYQS
jgi:membrane-associated protease RseP (regulator of RpoE activity)